MNAHPHAERFPMLPPHELEALAADIKANGQLQPIITCLGAIVDGRNREAACLSAGVTPRYKELLFKDDDDVLRYVVSANLRRRHLTTESRQEWALWLRQEGQSYRQIAAQVGASEATVRRDIATATATNDAVELPVTVTGKDGKERQAHATPREFTPTPPTRLPAAEKAAASVFPSPEVQASVEAYFEKVGELDRVTLHPSPASGPTPGRAPEKTTGSPAIMPSGYDGWNTPPALLEKLRAFGGGIALDPCSNQHSQVTAAITRGRFDCGLQEDWSQVLRDGDQAGGLVFVNPPYDIATLTHVAKHAYTQSAKGVEVVALVPAKIDQDWCQLALAEEAAAVCFVSGRVAFWRDGAPAQGSAFACLLLYWGGCAEGFCAAFESVGACLDLEQARQEREAA